MSLVTYTVGPGAYVTATETFQSFKVFGLLHDSTSIERQTLQRHRVRMLFLFMFPLSHIIFLSYISYLSSLHL